MALGKTGQDIGDTLGVTKAGVSAWETNKAAVSRIIALALQHTYKISSQWLLTGDGGMWAVDDQDPNDIFLLRPLISGAASCGPGGEIQDPGPGANRYALRRDFASRILNRCGGGLENDLYFLLCRGESMRPTILDKEIVLVNTAMQIRTQPRNNGIYLVRRSVEAEDVKVKRIRLDWDRRQLVMSSDNRSYAQALIDLDGVPLHQLILGRVVWVGRYLLDTDPPAEDW